MDLITFIALAKEWDRLGWAVQEQLDGVLDGEELDEQNKNALKEISRFMARFATVASDAGAEATANRIGRYLKAA